MITMREVGVTGSSKTRLADLRRAVKRLDVAAGTAGC